MTFKGLTKEDDQSEQNAKSNNDNNKTDAMKETDKAGNQEPSNTNNQASSN